jgi:hypothetical protein
MRGYHTLRPVAPVNRPRRPQPPGRHKRGGAPVMSLVPSDRTSDPCRLQAGGKIRRDTPLMILRPSAAATEARRSEHR